MVVCSVPFCTTKHGEIKMHVLPQDPKYFKIWAQAINRSDLDISKRRNVRICDLHFSDEMKFPAHNNRTNLVRNAIPTINIYVPNTPIEVKHQNLSNLIQENGNLRVASSVMDFPTNDFISNFNISEVKNKTESETTNIKIPQDNFNMSRVLFTKEERFCRICFCKEKLLDFTDPQFHMELNLFEKISDIKIEIEKENNFNFICSECKSSFEFLSIFSSTCKKANEILILMAENNVDICKTIKHVEKEPINYEIKFASDILTSRNEMLNSFQDHIIKHLENLRHQEENGNSLYVNESDQGERMDVETVSDGKIFAIKYKQNSLNNEILRVLNYIQDTPKYREDNEPNEYKENLERALKQYLEKRKSVDLEKLIAKERERYNFSISSNFKKADTKNVSETERKNIMKNEKTNKASIKCRKEFPDIFVTSVKILVNDVSKIKHISGIRGIKKERVNVNESLKIGKKCLKVKRETLITNKLKPKIKQDVRKLNFKYFRIFVQSKKKSKYSCHKCKLTFSEGREKLEHHYAIHARKMVCATCGKLILSNRMDRHLLSHKQMDILCDFCGKKFDSIVAFYAHRRMHVPKKKRMKLKICRTCGVEVVDLKNHMATTHRTQFRCLICNKTYMSLATLENHKSVHCGQVPYSCEFCGKGFTMKSHLNHHLPVHGKYLTKFKCKVCNESVKSLKEMKAHINKFHNKEPTELSSCKVCSKVFKTKQGLAAHMRTHNQNYTCPYCPQHFALEHLLNRHIESHTGNYRFKCHLCNQGFSYIQSLNNHVENHNEESKQCPICSKVFQHKRYLRKHMVVHDEKKYMCVYCNKMFTFKQNLQSHVSCLHTDEKPYQCSKCDKRMFAKKNYMQHIKKCTGAKVEQIYSNDDDLVPEVVKGTSCDNVDYDDLQDTIDANIIWK